MRVVMVGDFPRTAKEIGGGVEAVASYLATALQSYPDIDMHGVTLDRWGGTSRSEKQNSVPVHFVPVSTRPSRLSNWHNVRRMTDAIRAIRPDIVHAHIANQYAAAARRSGLPWVLTAHGVRHLEMALRPGILNRYREWTVRREEFNLMNAATHLISISPFITDVFAGHLTADVAEIDNPVDEAFFRADRVPRSGRILYVGRLIPRKDILTLLRAFRRTLDAVPGAELRLAGEGISGLEPAGYPAELKRYIDRYDMSDRIRFLGQLDDDALIAEYGASELMVVSSILETAPMVILQAMAAGVPVVSTDVGGIRYLVEEGRSGYLVRAGDAAALGDRIASILQDDELRDAMGRQAKQIALERLHADKVAQRTRDVYDRVLNAATGRQRAA